MPSAGLPFVSSKRYSRRLGACSSLPVPRPLIDTCLPSPAKFFGLGTCTRGAACPFSHDEGPSSGGSTAAGVSASAVPVPRLSQHSIFAGACKPWAMFAITCSLLSRTHHPPLLCTGVGGSSAAVPPRPLGGPSGGVFAGHMTPVYPAALGRPVGVGGAGTT